MSEPLSGQLPGLRTRAARVFLSEYLVLILAAVYCAALAPFTPRFATWENLHSVLLTLLPLFIVAVGQTVVMITGGIDLSQTSILALCSIAAAWAMTAVSGAAGIPAGILAALVAGLLVGAVNGLAVAWLRLPAFIATLTTMMFFSGLAIWLTRSQNIGNLPHSFNAAGSSLVIHLLVALGFSAIFHLLLTRSLWGRWVKAVGGNPKAAHVSGVPARTVVWTAYVVSGLLAAVAGLLYTAQNESGSPVLGQRLLLDIVGATVIGGTSLFGGRGKVLWTFFGVLFLKLIDNSLNLLDLSYFTIMIVKGGVILLAAMLDTLRNHSLT
jgi:ribose/xylose/arabinose/galactoside ABC-type transport system permease subunit